MCFNQTQSGILSGIALINAILAYYFTKNTSLTLVILYFFGMEFLQFGQYFYIDKCDDPINKFLTLLGYLHICFQPVFSNLMIYAFSKKQDVRNRYKVLLWLAFIGGVFMALRYPFAYIPAFNNNPKYITPENYAKKMEGLQFGYDADGSLKGAKLGGGRSLEMARGPILCTFSGRKHLGWSIPMSENTYYTAGISTHFMMMFLALLVPMQHDVLPWWLIQIANIFLFLTGPFMAGFITDDLMEIPSIWCFFSIIQIIVIQGMFVFTMGGKFFQKTAQKKERLMQF